MMKTSTLSAQTPKSGSLFTTLKIIWRYSIRNLVGNNELQVWQKTDCYGKSYWRTYDLASGRSTVLGSQAEMRMWIEQRYYQSN